MEFVPDPRNVTHGRRKTHVGGFNSRKRYLLVKEKKTETQTETRQFCSKVRRYEVDLQTNCGNATWDKDMLRAYITIHSLLLSPICFIMLSALSFSAILLCCFILITTTLSIPSYSIVSCLVLFISNCVVPFNSILFYLSFITALIPMEYQSEMWVTFLFSRS